MIPVAAGLLTVCGNRPGLGVITSLAIVAMVVMAAVSVLFVLGLVPFTADRLTASTSAWLSSLAGSSPPTVRAERPVGCPVRSPTAA